MISVMGSPKFYMPSPRRQGTYQATQYLVVYDRQCHNHRFGGSVGAEAPIVLTGSAIGSNLGKRV